MLPGSGVGRVGPHALFLAPGCQLAAEDSTADASHATRARGAFGGRTAVVVLKRHMLRSLLIATAVVLCTLSPQSASARNAEPGRLHLGAGLGPGLSMGSRLGTSPADFLIVGVGEWSWNRALSTTGAALIGVGGTTPLLGRLGLRVRAHSLGLAISPYAQLELAGGGLMRVLGSQLRWMGARIGGGVEYFATGDVTVGLGLGVHLGGTLGERPAFYGMADALLYVTFALNRSVGSAPPAPAADH